MLFNSDTISLAIEKMIGNVETPINTKQLMIAMISTMKMYCIKIASENPIGVFVAYGILQITMINSCSQWS